MRQEKLKILCYTLALTAGYILIIMSVMIIGIQNNKLIQLSSVNNENIMQMILIDMLRIWIPVAAFVITFRKINPVEKMNGISYGLMMIYFMMYIIVRDISIGGIYILLFYFGVGLSEELIFRKYLYSSLKNVMKPVIAGVISGAIWGIIHVIVPIASGKYGIWDFTLYFREIIRGIVTGFVYLFIWKKTKSIWNCVYVHAIWNYLSVM